MDPTIVYQDFMRMQQQVNQAADNLRSQLDHMSQGINNMHWMPEHYAYVNRQLQIWEDTIRHGRERTQRRNDRIEQFLKSTSKCPGENCSGRLRKTESSDNERVKAVIGPQYDVKCETCKRIIYLPPVLFFTGNAGEYLYAARMLRKGKARNHVAGVAVFLMHQAAELYLKGLGICSLYDEDDDDSEYIGGRSLSYTKHNLAELFQEVYPSLRKELEEHQQDGPRGKSIKNLINAIPTQTAEMFRYGFLLRGEYGQITISNGDALVNGKNISEMLLDLCTRLEDFTRPQRQL